MSMTFTMSKDVIRIKKPNWRKELHGDDKVQAIDLSLEYTGDSKIIDQLGIDGVRWSKTLWKSGSPVVTGLPRWIKFDRQFRNHSVTLYQPDDESQKFDDARITDFEVQPANDNRVEMRFQVQLHMNPEDMVFLAYCYENEMIHIEIEPPDQTEAEL